MVLIGKLVKTLTFIPILELVIILVWIRTPILEVHLKSFRCKRLNLSESFWHGPCASSLYSLWPFFFIAFVFFVFLGFALHNIHAFHSRLFLFFVFKNKNKNKKGSKMCFALFVLDLKSRLVNLFLHNMCMYLI